MVGCLLILILTARPAIAQNSQQAPTGKADYMQNCAQCHGADGKGNGPALYVVPDIKPPDLTLITAHHHGVFPTEQVRDSI
jgi:mono/diheme cytochrome c family protein